MIDEPLLPPEVEAEAGALVADLRSAGWRIRKARYDKRVFGNWFIELARDRRSIQLSKDRSQFMIDGPIADLREAGLLKAYDDFSAFSCAVLAWARERAPRAAGSRLQFLIGLALLLVFAVFVLMWIVMQIEGYRP